LVARYEDVNTLLRDRRLGRTYLHLASHEEMGRTAPPAQHDPFWHLVTHGILDMEPPDHTRVRRLVAKAFSPRMVESMRAPVQGLMDGLIEGRRGAGSFDLIAAVAEPLPVAIIAELLGIPEADRHRLRPWSADICRMYELQPTEEDAAIAVRASIEFSDYLRELSRERRASPAGDLISEMTSVVDDGDHLTEDELIDAIQGVHLLGIRSTTYVTDRVLDAAPDLLAIGAFCIGTNQIDLPAATKRGVAVFNAPYSNTRSVVELAIAEIISLARRLHEKSTDMHAGIWNKSAAGSHEIRGRTLGIVGYGNIGSQLSVIAEALGLRVIFFDLDDKLALGNARKCATLEELLAEADVVTLHVDGRPGNAGIFGD